MPQAKDPQIESSQASVAKGNHPNDSSKSNEPKRTSTNTGCHTNAPKRKFQAAVPKERVPSEMSHVTDSKRNRNERRRTDPERKVTSERAEALASPCERSFEKDHNRQSPNDSRRRKFPGESYQANISSEIQKVSVICRISQRRSQANVPSDGFQTTVQTRLFPSVHTHTKVLT